MTEILIYAMWFVGFVVLGYGVFAAPSGVVEDWYRKDRPYLDIRAFGAGLIFLATALALIQHYWR